MEVVTTSPLDQELIMALKAELVSVRSIALARQRCLSSNTANSSVASHCQAGLPVVLHDLLRQAMNAFLQQATRQQAQRDVGVEDSSSQLGLAHHDCVRNLHACLQIHLTCSQLDPCLAVELGAQGTHVELRRLIQFDISNLSLNSEEDVDAVMELQDVACEIAALYSNFPVKASPYTREALVERLPLTFTVRPVLVDDSMVSDCKRVENTPVPDALVILIHQVTTRQSAQSDVGFVMWPSAVVLSRWLLSNVSVLADATNVLEIGAGCGLVGLLAARLMQNQSQQHSANTARSIKGTAATTKATTTAPRQILLSDFNRTVLDNLESNIALNEVTNLCRTVGLDFYQQSGCSQQGWIDMQGHVQGAVDVILAADMICQPSDAVYAANTIHDALKSGSRAYVVCADAAHRFGVDHFAKECTRVGLQVTTESVADMYPNESLLGDVADMEKTAGFVRGMNLTMFFIEKPNQ